MEPAAPAAACRALDVYYVRGCGPTRSVQWSDEQAKASGTSDCIHTRHSAPTSIVQGAALQRQIA